MPGIRPAPTRADAGPDQERTPTEVDFVEAIATNTDVYALADVLPRRPTGDGGRPNRYPAAVYVIYIVLAGVLGSHRKAACAIANQHYWRLIRLAARKTVELDLPRTAPTRNMCEYHRGKIAAQVEVFAARYRELALAQAAEHSCLSPAAPRSATDPRRANFVAADGKVVKSPILKKTADRWRKDGRHIDASMHVQGGDAEQEVFGAKFWQATVRSGTDRNDRIIIDARRIPKRGYGGEAGIAVEAITDLAQRAPRAAWCLLRRRTTRCPHRPPLKKGLVVLSPTHSGTKPTALKRLSCTCGDNHELWTVHGRICERQILTAARKHTARAQSRSSHRGATPTAATAGTSTTPPQPAARSTGNDSTSPTTTRNATTTVPSTYAYTSNRGRRQRLRPLLWLARGRRIHQRPAATHPAQTSHDRLHQRQAIPRDARIRRRPQQSRPLPANSTHRRPAQPRRLTHPIPREPGVALHLRQLPGVNPRQPPPGKLPNVPERSLHVQTQA